MNIAISPVKNHDIIRGTECNRVSSMEGEKNNPPQKKTKTKNKFRSLMIMIIAIYMQKFKDPS